MDLKSLFSPNVSAPSGDGSANAQNSSSQPGNSSTGAPDNSIPTNLPVENPTTNTQNPVSSAGSQVAQDPQAASLPPIVPSGPTMSDKLGENLATPVSTGDNNLPSNVPNTQDIASNTTMASNSSPAPVNAGDMKESNNAINSGNPLGQDSSNSSDSTAKKRRRRRSRNRGKNTNNQNINNNTMTPNANNSPAPAASSPAGLGDLSLSNASADENLSGLANPTLSNTPPADSLQANEVKPFETLANTLNKLGDETSMNSVDNSKANDSPSVVEANTLPTAAPAGVIPSPVPNDSALPSSTSLNSPLQNTPVNNFANTFGYPGQSTGNSTDTNSTPPAEPEVKNDGLPTMSATESSLTSTLPATDNTMPATSLTSENPLTSGGAPASPVPTNDAAPVPPTLTNEDSLQSTASTNDTNENTESPTSSSQTMNEAPTKEAETSKGLGGFSLNEMVEKTADQTPLNTILTAQKEGGSSTAIQALDGDKTPTIFELLDLVVEREASDLHITVGYPIMIRIDGSLVPVGGQLVTPEIAADLINPLLPENKKELLEVNREVDLAYQHREGARFRINAYYQKQTMAAACRLIPNEIRTIDQLHLPQIYHQLTKLNQGLVLVTGPTGSGKSTTLAAILNEVNETRPDHIITIEDPIEYILPPRKAMVDQRELHEDTHSWEIALKSALRQDPDVMLVGEMRDFETISAAITLAETGHLVFATLHTNSASQTLDRIIDVFPEYQQSQIRAQLSNVVEAIIAQRLVPLRTGGRRAVSEIMIATPAVRNLIREAKTHQLDNVIATSADIGMVSIEHSLVQLVREGVITVEVAQEYAVHPEEVTRLLKA